MNTRKLKTSLLALAAALCVVACNSDKFVIDGYLAGIPDQDVYLCSQPASGEYVMLDTVRMKDGRFRFKGKMEYNDYRFITFQDVAGEIPLYIDNSKMELVGEFAHLDSVKVTGSDAMDYFNTILAQEAANGQYRADQIRAFRAAQQTGDTAALNVIYEESIEHDEAYARKIFEMAEKRPEDLLSLVMMINCIAYINPDQLAAYYEKVPSNIKTHPRMGTFDSYLHKNVIQMSKGYTAPAFTLYPVLAAGDTLTLATLKDKVGVLYVTNPEETELNERMYAELHKAKEKGAEVIVAFVFLDGKVPAGMKKYLEERGIADFKTGQADQEFFKSYVCPSSRAIFIGKDGKFLGTALTPEEAEAIISTL